MLDVACGPSNGIHWPRIDGLLFTGSVIVAADIATVGTGIDNLRVGGVRSDVTALAAAHGIPVRAINRSFGAGTCDAHSGIVLLRAVDVIGKSIVGGDVVKLRRGLVVYAGPTVTAVGGDGGATVVAVHQTLRIRRIDPERMIVSMWRANPGEGFAAVVGSIRRRVQNVYGIR